MNRPTITLPIKHPRDAAILAKVSSMLENSYKEEHDMIFATDLALRDLIRFISNSLNSKNSDAYFYGGNKLEWSATAKELRRAAQRIEDVLSPEKASVEAPNV